VCPWNQRFAKPLPDESAYAPREALDAKDARTLTRELIEMSQRDFATAFRGSPMKRAKWRTLARNAAVASGNVGTADDIPVLEAALHHDEPLVREHAVCAPAPLGASAADA
jgi:epoxyqueuosine reductase